MRIAHDASFRAVRQSCGPAVQQPDGPMSIAAGEEWKPQPLPYLTPEALSEARPDGYRDLLAPVPFPAHLSSRTLASALDPPQKLRIRGLGSMQNTATQHSCCGLPFR